MTILLLFCVLAAAGWFLLSLVDRSAGDDPGNSVADYSRAMAALDPSGDRRHRRPPMRSQQTTRPRPRPRPAAATASRRRAPARPSRRAVRR